jgi:hypothetical protein
MDKKTYVFNFLVSFFSFFPLIFFFLYITTYIINIIDKKLFSHLLYYYLFISIAISILLSLVFYLLSKRENSNLYKNDIVYVKSPSLITDKSSFMLLKNIEPMKKIIYFLLKKLDFKFLFPKIFYVFVIDIAFVNLIIFFATLLFLYFIKDKLLFGYYYFYNFFAYFNNTIFLSLDDKIIYAIYLSLVIFSIFFHEFMHMVGSLYSKAKQKIEFVSSGVGIVLFSPVAYVIPMREDGRENMDLRTIFSGPLGNAFLSTVFLILALIFKDGIFFMVSLINFLLYLSNVFPLMKFVDGKYIADIIEKKDKYLFFTNSFSSYLIIILSFLVILPTMGNIPFVKGVVMVIVYTMLSSFLLEMINIASDKILIEKKIHLKKKYKEDIINYIKRELLIPPKKEKNIYVDYIKKIIRTPYLVIDNDNFYLYKTRFEKGNFETVAMILFLTVYIGSIVLLSLRFDLLTNIISFIIIFIATFISFKFYDKNKYIADSVLRKYKKLLKEEIEMKY